MLSTRYPFILILNLWPNLTRGRPRITRLDRLDDETVAAGHRIPPSPHQSAIVALPDFPDYHRVGRVFSAAKFRRHAPTTHDMTSRSSPLLLARPRGIGSIILLLSLCSGGSELRDRSTWYTRRRRRRGGRLIAKQILTTQINDVVVPQTLGYGFLFWFILFYYNSVFGFVYFFIIIIFNCREDNGRHVVVLRICTRPLRNTQWKFNTIK